MSAIELQSIEKPHETRPFQAHGHMDVVTLGDFTLGKGTFEPGWKWSADVKPIAGTDSCQVLHTGFCVSGTMTIRMDDGTETTISPATWSASSPGTMPGSTARRRASSSTPASRATRGLRTDGDVGSPGRPGKPAVDGHCNARQP